MRFWSANLIVASLWIGLLLVPSRWAFHNSTKSSYLLFSFTTTTPQIVKGVEVSKQSEYDKELYLPYDKSHRQMSLNFQFADTRCEINQWYCNGVCIHRRERCSIRGGCHPQYPMSCEKKNRCYRSTDDCWHRACSGEECQWSVHSAPSQLGMKQRRFLASCPDEKERIFPCDTKSNPHIVRGQRQRFLCFYTDEVYCPQNKACSHISSKCFKNSYDPYTNDPVYPMIKGPHNYRVGSLDNGGSSYNGPGIVDPYYQGRDPRRRPINPIMRRISPSSNTDSNYVYQISNRALLNNNNYRNPNCPNKWTPCYGMCMDSDYPFKCGDDLCLSVTDMNFYRQCDGACIRNHVACNGDCRLGYTPCLSRNQCFKDPEGRCDDRRDCWDASDETGCFRTFLQWVALPTLLFLFLLIVAVFFTLGWFIRRTLAVKA